MISRLIVAHIHLFKNAGTSIEASLSEAFGTKWASYDGSQPSQRLLQQDLEAFLREHPELTSVSSHQLRPPLQASAEFRYLPIVFLRHPVDRIRSAYQFEKHQGPVSPSAQAAAEGSFAEWIDFHDGRGSHQCTNFQTFSLSSLRNDVNGAPLMRRPIEEHVASARSFLDGLGAVGLVEQFATSMDQMQIWLRAELPDFTWSSKFLNTGASSSTILEDRLGEVEAELGPQQYRRLVEQNSADIDIHAAAANRLSKKDANSEEPASPRRFA